DRANGMIEIVGDVEDSFIGAERNPIGLIELRRCSRALGKSRGAGTTDDGDFAGWIDQSNEVIVPVGHIDISCYIDRNRDRLVKARCSTNPIALSLLAVSGECPDITVGCDDTDRM